MLLIICSCVFLYSLLLLTLLLNLHLHELKQARLRKTLFRSPYQFLMINTEDTLSFNYPIIVKITTKTLYFDWPSFKT